jgi:uncharacterized protein
MRRAWVFFVLLLWSSSALAAFTLPERPEHYINDYANVLTPTARNGLEEHFASFERQTKHQAVVAIFPTIEGAPIDDVANKLFEKWRLGSREKNDGVLLVLAMQEHDVRIEVGYGLEDRLPDALAGRIIRGDMVPFLKQGQVATAILAFERRLEEIFIQGKSPQVPNGQNGQIPIPIFPFLLLVFIIIFIRVISSGGYTHTIGPGGIYRRRRSNFWWGGGGWGGGGGFGGGFGGGGGGLSGGGGASGRW